MSGKWKVILLLSITCAAGMAYGYSIYSRDRPAAAGWVLKSPITHGRPSGKAASASEQNRNLPARIIIPRINVDAPVGYMGLTKSGAMEVPSNIAETGWYKNGPLPGNRGSAVIAGHVNGPQGQPGVFGVLSKLQAGDAVKVTDLNGLSTTFIVRSSKTYGGGEQPDEVFHSSSGAHLNLITCVGDWDASRREFSQRLVVFTDKE